MGKSGIEREIELLKEGKPLGKTKAPNLLSFLKWLMKENIKIKKIVHSRNIVVFSSLENTIWFMTDVENVE